MENKRSNATSSFVIVGVLLTLFGFPQVIQAKTEAVNNFNANITIQKDGSVFIAETIIYDFGSNQKHGIFRDIPLTAVNGPRLNISVSGVSNEVGQPYQYATSIVNNVLQVKIGNPDALITGIKTYIINYQVYNAIRTFDDHDELYWNVTGNQWPVAIQNANALVILPDSPMSNVRMDCFTGSQGSTQKNCAFNQSGSNVSYSTTQPLNANEGLTLVLGIPLGYIQNTYVPPQQTYPASNTSTANSNFLFGIFLGLFIIFIFVLVSLFAWRAKTAKPKPVIPSELKGQPVVPEYNPPDNLPPIEIGALLDSRVDITDISSVIMDLAVRGYLKIRYTVQEIRFWPDKKDFELIKLKDGADLAHPADKIIFKLLFKSRGRVKLSDLKEQKTTFQSDIKKIQEDTEQHLRDEGYFDRTTKDKSKKLKTYLFMATAILFIGTFLLTISPSWFGLIFIASFAGFVGAVIVIPIMIMRLANKLTPRGIAALGKILGFKEFLQLTDKDKLRLLNAPELQPEMFEKFLPYAMVLGVEDKWAQKFEGIYNTIPNWYEDPTAASFDSYIFARNLTFFNSSFNQVFSIASPGSSSGFGGGGFSGGGSGGGGGRSW
ncbi:hypothetical protein A3B21_02140 [Candidatus Uhrbacteria bacterium RIFCSPLOWO2_01_FULL_47_24]|uniref:DUF2207 domain-containing protein n=1 Tax=Candidatus Uhrbacteria bacterium RIFCSPLOWO2_01_FULL_47_24 TaxID=1802401 RepID=A0A1F7UPC2_9BACT|nr:MAG: hypothetical protein A2753_03675 [Candidatus Uhrbacteria bacterium RIFCSPHIGHO2_01_FULL_47_11]OGL75436.1 MAG: hypothetical protein A3F52_05335 [Candidatus Uhrbacteria bacterium RIFCSPHIGHO2_12_FULL_47_11]OGL80153.1 MAG: hypothetical protein A3B21_02140 [Candidatus Uhrbacteria bacterium RIFCSPLOWO2_01_FULL_47_24]OGL84939.1 MAG: hypothetical protein A3J03_04525 [Candidatus Uhrbacteria bacterium RIFCSPLOWO2_02_FULL_46_25]